MLIVKNGKVLLDGEDITDRPVLNYIGFTHEGSVLCRPSPLEDRSEGTCIIPEIDDDRVYYRVLRKGKQVAYTHTRANAEKALALAEQMQYEIENSKEDEFFLDDLLDTDKQKDYLDNL